MKETMAGFKKEGIEHAVYGDIFLEDLRKYREEELRQAGLTAHFPLWRQNSINLLNEFMNLGYKTILVCVNEKYLSKDFAGRIIDRQFINELPATVDPCGENGEFHSFVFEGPLLKNSILFTKGEIVYRTYKPAANEDDECFSNDALPYDTGFWYCDLIPA